MLNPVNVLNGSDLQLPGRCAPAVYRTTMLHDVHGRIDACTTSKRRPRS